MVKGTLHIERVFFSAYTRQICHAKCDYGHYYQGVNPCANWDMMFNLLFSWYGVTMVCLLSRLTCCVCIHYGSKRSPTCLISIWSLRLLNFLSLAVLLFSLIGSSCIAEASPECAASLLWVAQQFHMESLLLPILKVILHHCQDACPKVWHLSKTLSQTDFCSWPWLSWPCFNAWLNFLVWDDTWLWLPLAMTSRNISHLCFCHIQNHLAGYYPSII